MINEGVVWRVQEKEGSVQRQKIRVLQSSGSVRWSKG